MTDTAKASDRLKEELQGALNDLKTLADEVRVKVHLGGLDAKDTWRRVESRLTEFEGRVAAASESVASDLRATAKDLRGELRGLGVSLRLLQKEEEEKK